MHKFHFFQERQYAMKKHLYTLSVLSSIFGYMTHAYGTADIQDDEEQSQTVAASSQPTTFAEWIQVVENNTAPKDADISNYYITVSDMRAFASALATNTSIEELNLQNCLIGDQSMKVLIKALKKNETLRRLSVEHNPISGYFLKKLLKVASNHPTLEVTGYNDLFSLDLQYDETTLSTPFLQDVVANKIEDLVANRAPSVVSIQMYAYDPIDLEVMGGELAFPRLRSVSVNFPMPLPTFETVISLIKAAPDLQALKLSSERIDQLYEDNKKNMAVGHRLLDAMQQAHHLSHVSFSVFHDSDDSDDAANSKLSLFNPQDPLFAEKLRPLVQAHPFLKKLSISIPEMNFYIIKHMLAVGATSVLTDATLHLSHAATEDINGLLFVSENKLVRRLSVDLSQVFNACDIAPIADVLAKYPFDHVTLMATSGRQVHMASLDHFLKIIARQQAELELDLRLPTSLLTPTIKKISEEVLNVREVSFLYHESLDKTDIHLYTSRIIGRRSLTNRLLPLLDDAASSRALPQRHIATN